jgi:hypothetical protein
VLGGRKSRIVNGVGAGKAGGNTDVQ